MARSDGPGGGKATPQESIVKMASKFSKGFPSLSEDTVKWQSCVLSVYVEDACFTICSGMAYVLEPALRPIEICSPDCRFFSSERMSMI